MYFLIRNNAFRLYSSEIPNPCGLINFWPFNGNYDDVIGGANLFGGKNFSLSVDRNGMAISALELQSDGYRQAPAGVYFNGDFSITFWFYLAENPGSWARVFDLGNGASSDNILIGYIGNVLRIRYYNKSNLVCDTFSTQNLKINTWYFIGSVLSNGRSIIYLNNVSSTNSITNCGTLPNITRVINYIGKSNWNDPQVHQKIDDLKFYNRALNITEIASEIASNFSCNILDYSNLNIIEFFF